MTEMMEMMTLEKNLYLDRGDRNTEKNSRCVRLTRGSDRNVDVNFSYHLPSNDINIVVGFSIEFRAYISINTKKKTIVEMNAVIVFAALIRTQGVNNAWASK